MCSKKINPNILLGGYFTGNLPEAAAACAFAFGKAEESNKKSALCKENGDDSTDSLTNAE